MPLDQSGSNTATADIAASWMRQYRQQKRRCDEENGILRNVLKRAKADGINTKSMVAAVKAANLDHDEVKMGLRDEIFYLGVLHVEMTQSDIFESYDPTTSSATQHDDDLWDSGTKGYRAGRTGVPAEDCPFDPGTERHVEWLSEWHKGKAAVARELGEDTKIASAAKHRPDRQVDDETVSLFNDVEEKAAKKARGRGRPRKVAKPAASEGDHPPLN